MSSFGDLGLCSPLTRCCEALGWKRPLPIQSSSIPTALKGNDIIGTSETGSGKTAAFLLPILQKWIEAGHPRGFGLILAPTRELALQIAETTNRIMEHYTPESEQSKDPFNVFRLIGGESASEQAIALAWCRHHLIVATPGRLAEHIKQSPGFARHHLASIRHLVLDEADRMLSLEFADDLDLLLNLFQRPGSTNGGGGAGGPKGTFLERRAKQVAEKEASEGKAAPTKEPGIAMRSTKFPHPQTYLFTATLSKDVRNLRRTALRRDAVICTANQQTDTANPNQPIRVDLPAGLRHYVLPVRRTDKLATVEWLLERRGASEAGQALVFCARCHETRFLAGFLAERGYQAVGLTGKMRQSERKKVLADFIAEKARILVATDVASRGLDLPFVDLVINYGVPLTTKSYRHRVGRTARAGREGTAVTIVTRDEGRAYLELESALLPTPKGQNRRTIPRWPQPLPSDAAMETRRRVAEEAWTRAAKAIREENERRMAANAKHDEEGSDDSDSGSYDSDAGLLGNDDLDITDLANQHWASGAAGIAAYAQAKRELKAKRRMKKMGGDEEEEGAGDLEMKPDRGGDDDDESDEERGNLNFAQPIKERRAAKRKVMVAERKKKKMLKRGEM